MKSTPEQLAQRGYLEEGAEKAFEKISFETQIDLLKSGVAAERTMGARLLAKSEFPVSELLMEALAKEKKLYAKMEICNALAARGNESIPFLTAALGRIGVNRHKTIPAKPFGKENYPLPRDICARTLVRIGRPALPALLETLKPENRAQASEAIDAIGFICFYDYQSGIFEQLQKIFEIFPHNDLLQWKIVRAMSAFPESKMFLSELLNSAQNQNIHNEISRSLRLIKR